MSATIQERFEEFDRRNPWVLTELVKLARQLQQAGHTKIGVRMLYEVIRWQRMRRTDDPSSEFKLNDHYISRYARAMVAACPELAEAVETRELRTI